MSFAWFSPRLFNSDLYGLKQAGQMKNSYAVILVTVIGVFLSVIPFSAFNGFGHRAEFPGNAPLTVEFLLSFLAQLPFGNKPGHGHHSLLCMAWGDCIIHEEKQQANSRAIYIGWLTNTFLEHHYWSDRVQEDLLYSRLD